MVDAQPTEVRYGAQVRAALSDHRPVVALESTIIAHGLPRPDNLKVANEVEQVVREQGAIPATIGMVRGELVVGLDESELADLATTEGVAKLAVRDLAPAAVAGVTGATTVASTAAVAARAGIAVFATGGLGGVHRTGPGAGTSYDESADLVTLAHTPIVVVCAGVKSILDVGATLERLETLGVTVVGYRTRRLPGFYLTDGGYDLDWSVPDPDAVAQLVHARQVQAVQGGALVVVNPLPAEEQLDPALHDRVLAEGLTGLQRDGITGKAVTPYLLAHMHAATGGASLTANVRVIRRNAALAGQVAVAYASRPVITAA